jgi:hypothetical protein
MCPFGIEISDIPHALAGKQSIHHPEGYVIPLSVRNPLPFMDLHPPMDHELDTYPHVFFTSDEIWNPTIMDLEYNIDDIIASENYHIPSFGQEEFNNYGEFNTQECSTHIPSHHK